MKHATPKFRLRPLAAAVSALTLPVFTLAPAGVRAQDATGLEEVVVTATRREGSIQDVPFNISAIGAGEIEAQRLTSLSDLARLVPGLNQVDTGSRGASLLVVRGLNSDSLNASEFLNNTSGDTVATYIGDVPMYMDLKLVDIERVEALLGPQGTLYGSGTLAGAIRYLPRRPDTSATTIEVHTKAYGLSESGDPGFEGDVVVNVPLLDGRMAFRGLVGQVEDPGFIDAKALLRNPGVSNPQPVVPDCGGPDLRCKDDVNDESTTYARASLLWDVSDNLRAIFSYYLQDMDAGSRQSTHRASLAGVPNYAIGDYDSAFRFEEPNSRRNELWALELTGSLELPIVGAIEVVSATGFSDYDEAGSRDQTDLLLNFEYGYETFPSFAAFTREEVDEKRFNQELRVVSKNESPLSWIAGGFFNYYGQDATSEEFTPGFPAFAGINRPDEREFVQTTDDDLKEVAAFGEVSYRVLDPWQVTFGARWFRYVNDNSVCFDLPLLSGSPDQLFPSCSDNSIEDDGMIYKVNTSYDLTDDATVYFTWSEGFRIGGVNAVPPCPDPIPPGQNVCALPNEIRIDPDTTTNYEIGAKTAWLDDRLRLNGAVFYIDWQKIRTSSTTLNGGIPIFINGAEARSMGLELAFDARIAERWRLQGGYSYSSAELTARAPLLVDSLVDGEDGDRLPGSPQHKGSVNLVYSQPLASGMVLDWSYGVTGQSNVLTKVGQRNFGDELDGFAIHNASVTLVADTWSASLYADNLTDEFAVTSVRQNRTFIRDVGGFRMRRYYEDVIRPLEVGVTFNYRFDVQ